MRAGLALVAMAAVGCGSPPAEAPAELQDLSEFLFQRADDEDPAELAAGIANLRDLNASVDFSLDAKDRAVTLGILQGEFLDGLPVPEGSDVNNQTPVGLARLSDTTIAQNVELATEVNRVCIESDTTKWAQRTFTEGLDCWPDCELRYEQPTRKENPLARVWYDQFGYYRLVDVTPEEGEPFQAIVHRYWIEEQGQSDGGNSSWNMLWGLDVTYELEDGGLGGYGAFWSWIDVFGIGPDSYPNLVINGLEQAAIFSDEFIAGIRNNEGECREDRDAEAPERP
ncbi:MAG: hypothetical protein AAF211_04310 [Myxococcota bacterium]